MSRWGCPTCFKSFSRKGDLTRHKLLHTGIRPHVCETCGKGFAQFSGLKTHRNVHSGDRPFVCGIGTCTKAFGDPSSRTRHRRETHRREGAFKCIIPDCGTRIKRRSAFVAHLRKHGLDPESLVLDAVVLQSGGSGIFASANFTSTVVENKIHQVGSESGTPPCLGNTSGYYGLPVGDSGQASYSADNNGWLNDNPTDCRRSNWPLADDALLLGPTVDLTVDFGSSGISPHAVYQYSSNGFKNPHFDSIFPTAVDYSLYFTPFALPAIEPFLEVGSDGFQSLSSPPLSTTYSALYTGTEFNDDVASLSLASNGSQESLLYDIM